MTRAFDVIWISECEPGYVVYRHAFDLDKCTLKEGAIAHKQALFKQEQDAVDFANMKNCEFVKAGGYHPDEYTMTIIKYADNFRPRNYRNPTHNISDPETIANQLGDEAWAIHEAKTAISK
jgi:hypothetical protein